MPPISRRRFASSLSSVVGVALAPRSAVANPLRMAEHSAGASPLADTPRAVIDLSSNENPYGPSPAALEAMTRSQAVAARYPDAAEQARSRRSRASTAWAPTASSSAAARARSCACATRPSSARAGRWSRRSRPSRRSSTTRRSRRPSRSRCRSPPTSATTSRPWPAPATRAPGLVYVCNPNNPTGTIVTRRRAPRLPRAGPGGDDRRRGRGVPPLRRGPGLPLRGRRWSSASPTSSSRGRSRRSTAWRACGSATRVASKANAEALRAQASWSNANAAVLAAAQASLADDGLVARQRERLNGTRRWLVAERSRRTAGATSPPRRTS